MASSAGKQEVIDLTMDDNGEIVDKQEDAVIPNDNICVENPLKQEANTGYGDENIPQNPSADESDSTDGDEKNTAGDEEYVPNSDLDEDEDEDEYEDEDGYEEDNDDDENIPILNREVVLALPAFKRCTPHSTHQKGPAIKQEIFDLKDDDEKHLKNEENGNDNDENGKVLKQVKEVEILCESDEENVPLMPFGHVVKTEPDPDLIKKEVKEETITRDLGKYPMFGIVKEDNDNQQSHHDQAQYDHDGYPMFGVFKQDINFQDEATPDRKPTRSELRRERKKWLGSIVYKDYGCMRHRGRVVDCNIETGWFKVLYEDSEYEDMEKEDLMRHLANPNQFRSLFNRPADRKHNPERRKEAEVKTKATTSSSSSKRKKKTTSSSSSAREAKKKEATPYIPLALREKKSDAYYWYSR